MRKRKADEPQVNPEQSWHESIAPVLGSDEWVRRFIDAKNKGYADGKAAKRPDLESVGGDVQAAYIKGYGEGADELAFFRALHYQSHGSEPLWGENLED